MLICVLKIGIIIIDIIVFARATRMQKIDLLYPKNNSVNTNIPKENSVVQYDTINWVINLVQQYGPYCLMTKTDIEDASWIIPFNPSDYYLLGLSWEGTFYFDKCLPMRASASVARVNC